MSWFAILLLALLVAAAFVLLRNAVTYAVRISFINASDFPRAYRCLPSYEAMMIHPRFYLLWTTAQWRAWLNRQGSAA